MGAQSDRLRCEVCQNLFLSPMNTGLLRYAVATALTVYGIETLCCDKYSNHSIAKVATALTVYGIETREIIERYCGRFPKLQQLLPFTVLKLFSFDVFQCFIAIVATALTVYGIETLNEQNILL